jgi:hypothetical protein
MDLPLHIPTLHCLVRVCGMYSRIRLYQRYLVVHTCEFRKGSRSICGGTFFLSHNAPNEPSTDIQSQHIILFGLFVICKLINRRWWVKLDPDVTALVKALDRLRWLKNDQRPTEEEEFAQNLEAQQASSMPMARAMEVPSVDGVSVDYIPQQ